MSAMKVSAGLDLFACALALGAFALFSFRYWENVVVACVPVAFALGLASVGMWLIGKSKSRLSKGGKILVAVVITLVPISGLILNVHIRHERKVLQRRAQDFLSRPVPTLFNTNELGGYIESRNANVLVGSRTLIERYANNGRIRWSAAIQGQMATAPFGMAVCEEAAKAPEERLYAVECKAILDAEWRMGFWQWVEDTMEMKRVIPEIEEEDAVARSQ